MNYVKICTINILIILSVISNVFAGSKWKGEAKDRHAEQCSGIEETKLACKISTGVGAGAMALSGGLYGAAAAGAGLAACTIAIDIFEKKLYGQEDKAKLFRDYSTIVNHQDLDNNGLNDFAIDPDVQDCKSLLQKTNPVTGENFTNSEISLLKGCKVQVVDKAGDQGGMGGGQHIEIKGHTYEIYNPSLDCDKDAPAGKEAKTAISIRYKIEKGSSEGEEVTFNEEKCIYEGECRDIDGEKLCVYKLDDMVCAEMVFCNDEAMGIMGALGLDQTSISGKVADGTEADEYGAGAVKSCSELCKYDEDESKWTYIDADEEKKSKESCLEKYSSCSIECPNFASCFENGELNQECEPQNIDKTICGFEYDPKYLAHCIPNKRVSLQSIYEIPSVISPYCTEKAVIRDDKLNKISAFSGRAVRCLDQTIRNIMHGSALVVDDVKRTYGYKCVGGSDQVFSSPSKCDYGLIAKFKNFAENIVTILLIISMIMLGIYIAFGLINDKKQILKYIVSFGIVLYFVNGDAWKDGYYNTLMISGADLALIAFDDLNYGISLKREDGSSFEIPRSYSCATTGDLGPDNIRYFLPDEKRYKIWDLLDCRWKTFFGDRGGEYNTASPKILRTASAGWLAILFVFFILILAIPIIILLFIAIALKAIFMFISAMVTISLLILVSPLVIPLVLFNNDKIKGIFKSWLQNLIGYSLVPLIIFGMLAIFFKGVDLAMYGTKEYDVFTKLSDGTVMVTDNCNEKYIPCLNYKMEEEYYEVDFIGNKLTWFSPTNVSKIMMALLQMLIVFAVIFMVFNYISKSLIASLLQVQLLDDDVVSQMSKAIQKGYQITKSAAVTSYKAGKHQAKKAIGKNSNDYGTKGVESKNDDD